MAHVESSYLNLPPSLRRTLKQYRWVHQITQEELARRLNTTPRYVRRWEQERKVADNLIVWCGVIVHLCLDWKIEGSAFPGVAVEPHASPAPGEEALTREERQFERMRDVVSKW